MSKIDDESRLRHMLDAAREISSFIQGKTKESLNTERMMARVHVTFVGWVEERNPALDKCWVSLTFNPTYLKGICKLDMLPVGSLFG